ncbi:hypothetical protein C5L31_000583 [Secundilactobacillus malefermentans]|uniref:Uncharacterized protein n=1 Tax=Secundilactobacillus malefermentans TaxID=176292 RepID=A0A4R5NRR6_9LACO|nr:hypothetical protein [Secundilactobacillus malefermentans]KRM56721.1 hypothetical protein FD44_GL001591 [Secundilactobacillus malefermentans DSM 5705 = KCTC 3548]TDG79819.1 hypothetical protein C5L31_000583 [Secundilactobacillus malefermentans]
MDAGEDLNINAEILTTNEMQKLQLMAFLQEKTDNTLSHFYLINELGYNKVLHLYHKLVEDLKECNNVSGTIDADKLLSETNFDDFRADQYQQQITYKMLLSILL